MTKPKPRDRCVILSIITTASTGLNSRKAAGGGAGRWKARGWGKERRGGSARGHGWVIGPARLAKRLREPIPTRQRRRKGGWGRTAPHCVPQRTFAELGVVQVPADAAHEALELGGAAAAALPALLAAGLGITAGVVHRRVPHLALVAGVAHGGCGEVGIACGRPL